LCLWVGIGAVALLLLGGYGIYSKWQKKAGFGDEWETYTALYEQSKSLSNSRKFPQSKLVLIDITKGASEAEISPLFYDLSTDVRATSADEVGCVGFVVWDSEEIVKYTDGFYGYTGICDLRLIDLESGEQIFYKNFRGEDPPMSKDYYGPVTAKMPTEKVTSFLENQVRWKTADEIAVLIKENKGTGDVAVYEKKGSELEYGRKIENIKNAFEEKKASREPSAMRPPTLKNLKRRRCV